jgi:hypothetical protein
MEVDPASADLGGDRPMTDRPLGSVGGAVGSAVTAPMELRAKREFNLCPLCWMPLYIDKRRTEDKNWSLVQYVFKGKPAFSIKNSGYKHERPFYVFGFSELNTIMIGSRMVSCQDCHFIHVSSSRMADVTNVWDHVDGSKRVQPANRTGNDNALEFFQNVNTTNGPWIGGVFNMLESMLGDVSVDIGMDRFVHNAVFDQMKDTFAGCPDCNSKMTIGKYIPLLFKLLFPPRLLAGPQALVLKRPRSASARNLAANDHGAVDDVSDRNLNNLYDPETQMYYVILSGMIDITETITPELVGRDNHDKFQITVPERQKSWSCRYTRLWCLIQILFSLWEDTSIDLPFRHHVSYVYSGVQDFYLSLLFFCVHCSRLSDRAKKIPFEAFHFFYASHFPFFLISKHLATGRSLSECVFGDDTSRFKFSSLTALEAVRRQFQDMRERVLRFWNTHFKCLSNFILDPDAVGAADYRAFFCHPGTVMAFGDQCVGRPLSIQSFRDYFRGKPGYWFHFKYITMAKIERECEKYHNGQPVELARRVWDEWYHFLCQHIALLDTSPPVRAHLSAVLREMGGGPGRWRMKI